MSQILKIQNVGEDVIADEHAFGRQSEGAVPIGGKSVLHIGRHLSPVEILKGESEQAGEIPADQSFLQPEAEHDVLAQPLSRGNGIVLLRQADRGSGIGKTVDVLIHMGHKGEPIAPEEGVSSHTQPQILLAVPVFQIVSCGR